MSTCHIADTGLFVALGAPDNERYRRVRTFARRNGIVFQVPRRVHEELTTEVPAGTTPGIDTAIEEDWATVAEPLDYTNPLVSRTMDGVQRYIAAADDRSEDEVERADAALGGLAAQMLVEDSATQVYVYTTDISAGEGIETALEREGYGDAVTFVNAFAFVDDLVAE